MPTKQELMLWLKTYKKENCVPISKMNKNELYEEAKKHGYLQQKYGIKKKTKNKTTLVSASPNGVRQATVTSIRDAFPENKTEPKTAPKTPAPKTQMMRKEIYKKIKELEKVDMLKISNVESKKIANERKKLFDMLKEN